MHGHIVRAAYRLRFCLTHLMLKTSEGGGVKERAACAAAVAVAAAAAAAAEVVGGRQFVVVVFVDAGRCGEGGVERCEGGGTGRVHHVADPGGQGGGDLCVCV